MRWSMPLLFIVFLCGAARPEGPISPPDDGHGWTLISEPIIKQLAAEGKTIAWPGQTTGVCVDRAKGDVWIIPTGQGVWRSTDRGQTYQRIDGGVISGRCETGYAINGDPEGGRFAFFMLDGKCGMTLDGGKTWGQFADVGRNWDYAAVDWSDPQAKTIFAARHESDGEMYLSADAGKSWKQIGKDAKFAAVGIFDSATLVTTQGGGILRSTDAGATWTKVSDLQPTGRVMVVRKGVAWWVAQSGVIVSRDKGLTWEKWGEPVDGAGWGPWFGKDEGSLMLATKKDFVQTRDGGKTWMTVAAMPDIKDFKPANLGWFLSLAWDADTQVVYASRMGFGTYRYQIKP
jgi:hypothetical protein